MKKDDNKNSLQKGIEKIANGVNFPQTLDEIARMNDLMMKQKAKVYRSLDDLILANLIVLFAVFLSAFIPMVSFALPVLVFIYLEIGLGGFVYKKECGQKCQFEEIFTTFKKFIKAFCIFAIKMILTIFGLCLLIVPGVVVMLNYAFTSIILFESTNMDVKSILMLSKEFVKGHRLTLLFYFLLALASVCIVASLMFCVILLFDLFLDVSATYYIIFIVLASLIAVIFVAIPMVEITIADVYIVAKKEKVSKFEDVQKTNLSKNNENKSSK